LGNVVLATARPSSPQIGHGEQLAVADEGDYDVISCRAIRPTTSAAKTAGRTRALCAALRRLEARADACRGSVVFCLVTVDAPQHASRK